MRLILCVDDNDEACELIELVLTRAIPNLKIECAKDSMQAVELLKRRSYDLYILDYWLPEMDGPALCRRIRELYPEAPVIFYSAAALPSEKRRGLAAGANRYLVKPDDFERLPIVVRAMLAGRPPVAVEDRNIANEERVGAESGGDGESGRYPGYASFREQG